jgi:hypothetical protein
MRIPRERLEVKPTFEGRDSPAGWLEINLKGIDLEGVTRLYVDMADLEGLRSRQSDAEDLFKRLRGGLGSGDSG